MVDTTAQTYLTLRSGDKMPQGGYGLWKLPKDVTADMVVAAVEAGYRLLDGACDYGNEKEVGEGLKRLFDAGTVKREDLFIVSKLWNTFHNPIHVEAACKRSLSDLGLEYLDLYLIHFPIHLKYVDPAVRYPPEWIHDPTAEKKSLEFEPGVTYQMTWQAMEKVQEAGLARNIGVSNLNFQMFNEIFQYCKIKPAVLQIEMHPFCVQDMLARFVKETGTQLMAYSNLAGSSYIEIGLATKDDILTELPVMKTIAEAHGKTTAQVALRWGIQRGTTIVPKTATKSRLAENIDLFSWSLTEDEMKTINGLDKKQRFNDPGNYAEGGFGTYYPMYC